MAFDVGKIREDFPILSRRVNGNALAYLDNAATTQKPKAVLDAMRDYYENSNANAHRGGHALAEEATEIYENARKKVARFIGASPEEIIFTRNATEALNFVAMMTVKKGTRVLLSQLEHHSNIVGWQLRGARLEYAMIRGYGGICISDTAERLQKRPAVFSFSHASNVLGNVNDAANLCKMAKKAGALSCVDAAQSAPHVKLDVREIGCDFLAFSAHKMLGPAGIGVLYIRKEAGERLAPVFGGGGMIEDVGWQESAFAAAPQKFEPGTQDVAGAVGLAAAMDYLEGVGMAAIGRHVAGLHKACVDELPGIAGVRIYGNGSKTGIVSFNVGKLHAHDVSEFASQEGVMIRAGHHCAKPLMRLLGVSATARASFYLYNTEGEAGRLVAALKRAKKVLS
jgi:cysteine desulfurase/selenocysteine lyase